MRPLSPGVTAKPRPVLIFLPHNMVDVSQMAKGIGLGVWGAIDRFHTLASAKSDLE